MGRPRYLWGAAAAAVAGLSAALVLQEVPDGSAESATTDSKPGPVKAETSTIALRTADGSTRATLRQQDTKPFSMLGITWTDPSVRVAGNIEVRTRTVGTGEWSDWLRLDGDSGQGDSTARRGGTDPAWVGASDGVAVRVTLGGRTSIRVPAGLRLDMIDPGGTVGGGKEPAESAAGPTATEGGEPAPTDFTASGPEATEPTAPARPMASAPTALAPTAPRSSAARPAITSRAGWGADESISPGEPGYLPGGRIKAVVVHHTAESNAYTCAEAPAVVRGIYAYHVQQLGWRDIGYNFLVDKCGTLYEGRKGGVNQPVMGAHAYGFNAETTGISVLGTYTDVAPSEAALVSVAKLAAWKLGQYGVSPTATTTLTAGAAGTNHFRESWAAGARLSFPTVHGHRDGYNTQCPGDSLYAKLPTLRKWAAEPATGPAKRRHPVSE